MTYARDQKPAGSAVSPPSHTPGAPWAASAIAMDESWEVALERVSVKVLAGNSSPPDVLLLFASAAFGASFGSLVHTARERTGANTLVGCSASGFLAGAEEVEDQPGVSMLALWLPGAHIHPIRLHQEHVELLDDPAVWHETYGIPPAEVNSWLVFAEPFRIDTQALIQGLHGVYPGTAIMGGMASGMVAERTSCVFFDDQFYDEGGVALGIGGAYSLHPLVSQGCDPVGESWTITEVDHHTLLGISNRPALEVLQETLLSLTPGQRERAQNNLVVGLAANEYLDSYHRGDFLVRGILGIDPRRGAISVGGVPRAGQTIQFHLRDATSARDDLVRMTQDLVGAGERGVPIAAVLCTCDGRGESLFGVPDHDAAIVDSALGGVPLVGAFCIGEIGPLGNKAVLHGFTATLGVLRHFPEG